MSIQGAMRFSRRHIIISNGAHALLGFGLAIVLQDYFMGNSFIPMSLAWLCIVLGLVEHVRAWMSK